MRDKLRVVGDRMSVVAVEIGRAREWAEYLLQREGMVGDKLTWVADKVEQKWGAPASIILRLRNRHDISDMRLSNWLRLKRAYDLAEAAVERQAQHQEALARAVGIDADNSKLYRAGAVLAGAKDEAEP